MGDATTVAGAYRALIERLEAEQTRLIDQLASMPADQKLGAELLQQLGHLHMALNAVREADQAHEPRLGYGAPT